MWMSLLLVFVLKFLLPCAANNTTVVNHLQEALRFVQDVENKAKCEKVMYLDVLLDHTRWKREGLLVVEVANLMTSLWRKKKLNNRSVAEEDDFLYGNVRSIVMFSRESFGSVICFDKNQYKDYYLFCPYAFKPQGRNNTIEIFDIAAQDGGYDYDNDNNAIWWKDTKVKALTLKLETQTEFYAVRVNSTVLEEKKKYLVPVVRYSDGVWTRPYYDCFGGKIWMVTYMAPFFNESNQFLGAVSIDIQLKNIDINQCDQSEITNQLPKSTTDSHDTKLAEFMGTHRCKKATTKCVHLPNQGFKRGSYICECKKGFYFPNPKAKTKHFEGKDVEAAYDADATLEGKTDNYKKNFECIPCSRGCSECIDNSPCIYSENYPVRILLVCINAIITVMVIAFGVVIYVYRKDKVIKASSPRFLIISIAGAVTVYTTPYVMLSGPTSTLCIVKAWLYHMGFLIAYSSIIIKTWRVAVIFRVRSAQRMALTDAVLMRRLLFITMSYVIYMLLWTNISPPKIIQSKTSEGLIFHTCAGKAWSEILERLGHFGLLTWGMWVCYQVRNAPSAYNESKFASWSIYIAMFVSSFSTVLRFTKRDSMNPDVMYALNFVFDHLTVTVMISLIAVHKIIHIRKNHTATTDTTTNGSSQNPPCERFYTNTNDATVTVENEELRGEIERLVNKVAVLQSQLMQERNKHVHNRATAVRRPSRLARLGFGLGILSNPANEATVEEPVTELSISSRIAAST